MRVTRFKLLKEFDGFAGKTVVGYYHNGSAVALYFDGGYAAIVGNDSDNEMWVFGEEQFSNDDLRYLGLITREEQLAIEAKDNLEQVSYERERDLKELARLKSIYEGNSRH